MAVDDTSAAATAAPRYTAFVRNFIQLLPEIVSSGQRGPIIQINFGQQTTPAATDGMEPRSGDAFKTFGTKAQVKSRAVIREIYPWHQCAFVPEKVVRATIGIDPDRDDANIIETTRRL